MRKTPLEAAPAAPAIAKAETPNAGTDTQFVDLSERLKKKVVAANEPAPEKNEQTSATVEETAPGTEEKPGADQGAAEACTATTPGSATFDGEDGFDKFAKAANEKFSEADAIEIAEMIVQFGNIGRIIFLPGIYEGLMYPGQERNDIRDVMRRSVENEKKVEGREATFEEITKGFNGYDLRLYAKWPLLRKASENVSFTEPEIKTFAKYLAREIGEMTVSVWMQKHMWLMYWLYLETKHASTIIQGKASDFMSKKFGLK